ncbi:SDR family oxidoreductase [Luteolibacter pohnpeiensis]|uniref:SDR family oxidoreductase n=1 Tax=Luteolibacter pohnpeiensis TaxID=454153 RepID=A0A934S6Y1_9BACT|nr:SDR family oxidoreductase [Luteolibacter pohnpeiensis]MBK1882973.1 SDR family oxidoreductase [Luteolibacter pohnpeiensis]
MKLFVTGATGFIGTAVVAELMAAGHEVLGLARSEDAVQKLSAAGAIPHRGDLENLESLQSGAAESDGVIHTGFIHDFSRFQEVCAIDARAIEVLGSALAGSDRPLVISSGTGMGNAVPGEPAKETYFDSHHPNPRAASEIAGNALLERGVNVSVVRLPQVHDPLKQGLISYLIEVAREKGKAGYLGDGEIRWPAVHRLDAARLYRLVAEKAVPGARYHAVAEEGVAHREIAEVIGRGLEVPVVSIPADGASDYFGWLAMFARMDMTASSQLTRELLDWEPVGPGLISDLEQMRCFGS